MNWVFADTFYFIALLNRTDHWHERANHYSSDPSVRLMTTAFVLTELADGLAATSGRRVFSDFLEDLESDPRVKVIQAEDHLWRRAVSLYHQRNDKDWSLTDCTSFIVMRDHGVKDALTGDHHFQQAGFRILLS